MWVSTRKRFRKGDKGWDSYTKFIGLPQLSEVRTIDRTLNNYVDECGSLECSLEQLEETLKLLPSPKSENEYFLLYIDRTNEPKAVPPSDWELLGYDLSDDTLSSSVLNCGPWEGNLKPITSRLNGYGLLTWEDAKLAQTLLPTEWNEDPHSFVTIWACYGKK